MNPVFAGQVREGASDAVLSGLHASEVKRFRSNGLSSSDCKGNIATTPVEIFPMVPIGS